MDLVENDEKRRGSNVGTAEMEGFYPFVFRLFLVECGERTCSTAVDVVGGATDGCVDGQQVVFMEIGSLGHGPYVGVDVGGKGFGFCCSSFGICRKQGQIVGVGGGNQREERGVFGQFSNHFVVCVLQQAIQRAFGGPSKNAV